MNEEVIVKMGMDTSPFAAGLRSVRHMSTEACNEIKNSFMELGRELIAPLSAVAAIGAFERILDYAEKIKTTSESFGVSTTFLQTWSRAASENGASAEKAQIAIGKLAEKIGQARDGSEEAIKIFRGMGVSLYDSAGNGREVESVIGQVADRIHNAKDGAERARIAFDAFGKSGLALIPILLGGSKGLADMTKEYLHLTQAEIDVLNREKALAESLKNDLSFLWSKATYYIALLEQVPKAGYKKAGGVIGDIWESMMKGDLSAMKWGGPNILKAFFEGMSHEAAVATGHIKEVKEALQVDDSGAAARDRFYENRLKRSREESSSMSRVVQLKLDMVDIEEQLKNVVKENTETYMLRDKLEEKRRELKKAEKVAEKELLDIAEKKLQTANAQNAAQAKLSDAKSRLADKQAEPWQYTLEELRNSKSTFGGKLGNDQRLAFQIKEWENRLAYDKERGFGDDIKNIDLPKIQELRNQLSTNNVLPSERNPDAALEKAVAIAGNELKALMSEHTARTIFKVIPYNGL